MDDDALTEARPAGQGLRRGPRITAAVSTLLVPLVPFLALPVLTAGRWTWGGSWRLTRGWWVALGPLAAWAILRPAIAGEGGGLAIAVALIALAAWAAQVPARPLVTGGMVALALLTMALAIERQVAMATFHDVRVEPALDLARVAAFAIGYQRLHAAEVTDLRSRFWRSEGRDAALTVSFELRVAHADVDAPSPPVVELAIAASPARRAEWIEIEVEPSDAWRRVEVASADPSSAAGQRFWTGLRVWGAPGAVDVRRFAVAAADHGALSPVAFQPRQRLWFGGPNLLGHTLTATGLMVLAASHHPVIGAATIAFTVAGHYFTGSRTATATFLVFAPLLWLLTVPRRRWWIAAAGFAAVAAVAALSLDGDDLGRLGRWSLEDRNVLSRSVEMRDAWTAMVERPWLGVGEGGLSAAAHNAWLQLGAEFGLPGLLAGVWFAVAVVAVAWRFAGWHGVWLVGGILVMQTTDDSWRYPGVFLPLLLGVAARSARGGAGPEGGADESGATQWVVAEAAS